MSAGQQQQPRKRPTNPPDHHHHRSRPKRPKLDSPLNLSPHVRLRWDGASRRVVPAQDQIGIPWSRLAPFVATPPRHRASRLADVAPVPPEVFALDNLKRVLSYEVWDKCLTEADRNFLAQFLPIGTDPEETLRSLLTAKNHHFGNPMLTWSSALCYGDLHPDSVLTKERQIRDDKKEYRAQLNEYHSDMTEILIKWKDKWLTCDDPQSLFRDNPVKQKRSHLQPRAENAMFSKSPNNPVPIKVVRNGDVTKFMSYIKITRSQHDLVKRMKQSGDGIQTKHLAAVIGDIDNFHVKPYETLMEDEKKKLHAYWAILSRKELPAAFESRWERKSMAENLRTSLCLELAERSMPEAEQVADRTTYQNGGISDEQEEPVDHSPSDVPQTGDDSSPVPEDEDEDDNDTNTSDTDTSTDSHGSQNIADRDVNGTSDTGTSTDSHDSPNMSDQDGMDMNNTNVTTQSQGSADEQDEELEKISGMNTSPKSGNSSDRQDAGMEDARPKDFNPGTYDGHMEDTSCKDTALQDHNIPDMQAHETKAICHTISPIQSLKNTCYTGFPIDVHGGLDEQTGDLKNILSHYPSASPGHGNKNQTNHIVLDHRGPEGITMMSSDSTVLVSKPLCKQNNVDEGPELNGHTQYQEVLWQSASPVDSFYRPPGNSLYAQSAPLQLKRHLPGGAAASMIDLGMDARRRQQAQIAVTAALPMCNPASLLPPCTNQLTSEQLLNGGKGIGMVPSYSLGHMNGLKQSVGLHSMASGHLAQSGLVQEQMQLQMLDERHNGLFSQQVENNMLYSGTALCTQDTFAMVEPQANFAGHAQSLDQSPSWFPDEQQPSQNNNWSGMESNGMVLGQDLPRGDGSLSSVLSQYEQVSSRVQLVTPSSDQLLGRRNLVPPHGAQGNILPPAQAMYGYTQNNNLSSSQVDGRNLQWAQGGGHGMAHPPHSFRQFGGDPWSR